MSHTHKTGSLKYAVIVLLAAALCGCPGKGADNQPGSRGQDGKVTIRISHWWADSQDLWEQVIAAFEKTHPNIHVEQEVLSFDLHLQKVLTSAAAGQDVGDLLLFEDWFVQESLNRDFLINLQPMADSTLKTEDIFAMSLESFRGNDKSLRAFPIALGSYPLFYNKKLFDDAGLRYPDSTWTYDTLLSAAKKLTVDKNGDGIPDQWGLVLDNNGFDGFLWSNGGAVLTDDKQKSAFATPGTISALKLWVDLVRVQKVAPENVSRMGGGSSGGSLRPFETGNFGMGLLNNYLTFYQKASFPWDIALPPKGTAGRKCLRFAAAFGIPASSAHKAEAWEFLRWMVKEMPAGFCARLFFGMVPNSRRLAGSPEYLQGLPKASRQVVIDMIEKYSFSYWRSGWQEFRDHGFLPELDNMVSGRKTVEQAAADADKRINEVLQSK